MSEWACDMCTSLNPDQNQVCEICMTDRPKSKAPAKSASSGGSKGAGSDEKVVLTADEILEQQIKAQQDALKAEIDKQPLVSIPEQCGVLKDEYSKNALFLRKIEDASKKYKNLRRVRGDGNCFYRAFLFSAFEQMLSNPLLVERFTKFVDGSLDRLVAMDYPKIAIEDFFDMFGSLCKWMKESRPSLEQLEAKFNDDETSDIAVFCTRFITSCHVKMHATDFAAYITTGKSIDQFCASEIESMGSESDNMQVVALATELDIPIRVEYLDQTNSALNGHVFPEGREPLVHLLYRPGHYDVLYPIDGVSKQAHDEAGAKIGASTSLKSVQSLKGLAAGAGAGAAAAPAKAAAKDEVKS